MTVRLWSPHKPQWRRLKSENEVGLKEVSVRKPLPTRIFATGCEEEVKEEEEGTPAIRKDIRPAGRDATFRIIGPVGHHHGVDRSGV